jgi:hypothetical protein
MSILQERGLKASHVPEVCELQTALGLVASAIGVSLVPEAVQTLRRVDVVYRPLQVSLSAGRDGDLPNRHVLRMHDKSDEITALLQLAP